MINTDSIKLNNLSMGQYLTGATLGYYKLWSPDTGRNMAGTNYGTLVGIFPKLRLNIRKTNNDEIALIATELNKANITTTYYDVESKTSKTMSSYAGDIEIPIKRLNSYEGFEASVIANSKRT